MEDEKGGLNDKSAELRNSLMEHGNKNVHITEEDGALLNRFQYMLINGNTDYDEEKLLLDYLLGDNWQTGLIMRLARNEDSAQM